MFLLTESINKFCSYLKMSDLFEIPEEEEPEFADDQFRAGVGTATKSKLTHKERIAIEIKNEYSELPQTSTDVARVVESRVSKIDQIAHVNPRLMAITVYLLMNREITSLTDIRKLFIEDDLWNKATQRLTPDKSNPKQYNIKLKTTLYKYAKSYLETA